jgi:hypothetical protein
VDITQSSDVVVGCGGLAGGTYSSLYGDSSTIQNCTVTGTVTGYTGTGGVVGIAVNVEDCSFSGAVAGRNGAYGVGGVAGDALQISGCRSDGSVSGGGLMGGVAGFAHSTRNCYSLSKVFMASDADNQPYAYIGGVIGQGSQIGGCYFGGVIGKPSDHTGGLVGLIATHDDTAQGRMEGLLMAGNVERGVTVNLIAGAVSSEAADASSVLRARPVYDRAWESSSPYNGDMCSDEEILNGSAFQTYLAVEGQKWDDVWKPIQPGYYPQLKWENGPPTKIVLE